MLITTQSKAISYSYDWQGVYWLVISTLRFGGTGRLLLGGMDVGLGRGRDYGTGDCLGESGVDRGVYGGLGGILVFG